MLTVIEWLLDLNLQRTCFAICKVELHLFPLGQRHHHASEPAAQLVAPAAGAHHALRLSGWGSWGSWGSWGGYGRAGGTFVDRDPQTQNLAPVVLFTKHRDCLVGY